MKLSYDQGRFWYVYGSLLHRLLSSPIELNERTGVRIRVVPGAVSFGIDLADRIMPTAGLRKVFPRVAAAEIAWYLSGERDATWMTKHAPIWDKFIEPINIADADMPFDVKDIGANTDTLRIVTERIEIDGKWRQVQMGYTFDGVKAAYGYRWRHHFERDQLGLAIKALRDNPSDRRVMVSAWDPALDGLGAPDQKNVPCPAVFTLNVVGEKLHSTMLLRSSDVFVGLPYDVLGHALLMDAIANELGLELGIMHFTLAHAHLYESHWDLARDALAQEPVEPQQFLPGWTVSAIEKDRDLYVEAVKKASALHRWPSFSPRPEVIV